MAVSKDRLRVLMANNTAANLETKTCIKTALLTLMNQKRYEEIRMTDIIRKSGISRSGVYKNYKSKEDILVDIYRIPIEEILSALSNSVFDNLEMIFHTGKKHEASVKAILYAGLEHKFLELLNARFAGVETSFYIPLWNGMLYNAFMEWARAGMNDPVEDTVQKVKEGLKLVADAIDSGMTNRTQDMKV